MSREPFPFHATDVSALARSLEGQMAACGHLPGHVEMLNMLARAAGCRNFQHLRAQATARAVLEAPPSPEPEDVVNFVRVRRMMRLFDAEGRLLRWPPKQSERELCLWVLWAAIPAKCAMGEPEVNRRLDLVHHFGDHALLRRWLCDFGLMTRTRDGSVYRRIERRPTADALALFAALSRRATG